MLQISVTSLHLTSEQPENKVDKISLLHFKDHGVDTIMFDKYVRTFSFSFSI